MLSLSVFVSELCIFTLHLSIHSHCTTYPILTKISFLYQHINIIAMSVFILEITLLYCLSYLYKDNSMFLPHPKEHMVPQKIELCATVIPDFVRNLFFHIRHPGLNTEFSSPAGEPTTPSIDNYLI